MQKSDFAVINISTYAIKLYCDNFIVSIISDSNFVDGVMESYVFKTN